MISTEEPKMIVILLYITMLFQIDRMLILADSKDEAASIFQTKTGIIINKRYVHVLINKDENSTFVDTLQSISSVNERLASCINLIKSKYSDPLKAVNEVAPYLKDFTEDQINTLFDVLLVTKYNETKPLLKLCSSITYIPEIWFDKILKHVSYYWIKIEKNQGAVIGATDTVNFIFDPNNQKLLSLIGYDSKIIQDTETDELISLLDDAANYNIKSRVLRLLNSINFSLETLDEFVSSNPSMGWVLNHYEFKQNLFRKELVLSYNDRDGGHQDGGHQDGGHQDGGHQGHRGKILQ